MIIEMNKKYKTRNGQDVRIYAVDGIGRYSVHGAVDVGDGYLMRKWTVDGYKHSDEEEDCDDLVEVKEDWEILVEHFKNEGEDILVLVEDLLILIHGVKLQDYQDYFSVLYGDGLHINTWKGGVKIAKLEDCKKYILEG